MKRRSQEEGLQLVADYHASGLPQTQFAKKARINLAALGYWLRRVRALEKPDSKPVQFVELTQPQLVAATNGVCIETPSGTVVRLEQLPPADYVSELVLGLSRQ